MVKRKTHEQFVKEVFELVGEEYEVCGEYRGNKAKLIMEHTKCNYRYTVAPNNFLNGKRCPKCALTSRSKAQSKSTNEFKDEVYKLTNTEYTVLGEYVNAKTKILIRHNDCEYEWEVEPTNFISGNRCLKCSGRKKLSHEEFVSQIYDLVGDEYVVLERYIDNGTPIKIKHVLCNHFYKIKPNNFITGNRCPKCSGLIRKTTEVFKNEVFSLVKDEFTVLGDYINNHTKIKIRHEKCGKIHEVIPNDFTCGGTRCPRCRESKGEKKISQWLDANNVDYIPQYKFEDCQYKRKLPFDFAIFNADKKITSLIEYDGEQHFSARDIFGGQNEFKLVQLRDQIKNNFCKQNNIPLLRIPYWEFDNIESILEKELNKFNSELKV